MILNNKPLQKIPSTSKQSNKHIPADNLNLKDSIHKITSIDN